MASLNNVSAPWPSRTGSNDLRSEADLGKAESAFEEIAARASALAARLALVRLTAHALA